MTKLNKLATKAMQYKRPHASDSERAFINNIIMPVIKKHSDEYFEDDFGNIYARIGQSRTMFTAHTDTVHPTAGTQKVRIDKDNIMHVVDGECLGADDAAGTLVLLALMEAKVPALYAWFRLEERGGQGSKWAVEHMPDYFTQFDRAVAFDRRGTSSVISHQGWGRCCSDTFAEALSDALSTDTLMYAPDDTGVYTDTAEFVSIIPECTNISVGYDREHSTNETQDLNHLRDLIACAVELDWEALPVERDPAVEDDVYGGWYKDVNFGTGWTHGAEQFTDYNMMVYDACEYALDDEPDYLLYMIAEAINPADPDETYERIWHMPLPAYLVRNCLRQVDYAQDDAQTERALVDLYQAVVDDNIYQ